MDQPGYILRQLWMQAAELAEDDLAEDIRSRLQSLPGPGLVPRWTTRRASRALSSELGRHYGPVNAVAVLPDGRVVTGGGDGQVLVWDPAEPATGPFELGPTTELPPLWVNAVAVLADGRVVTGGDDGRVVIWDPAAPGAGPPARRTRRLGEGGGGAARRAGSYRRGERVLMWDPAARRADPIELGTLDDWVNPVLPDGRLVRGSSVNTVAVLPDGRVVSGSSVNTMAVLPDWQVVPGGYSGQVLVWDPAAPGADPAELGTHDSGVNAVAVLPDGRVVTVSRVVPGGSGGLLVWDPAVTGSDPAELGSHDSEANAVAVLPDGRVVTGGGDGQVLVWDPATPGADPAELGPTTAG